MTNQPSLKSLNERLDVDFALKAAGLGIWELDPISNIVSWDARCRELFGFYKDSALTYDGVLNLIHTEDVDRIDQAIKRALDPKSDGRYDVTYRVLGAHDGVLRWVRIIGQSYVNESGQVYRFAGVAQDVTKDLLTQQRLEASEERFRKLIEESTVASCLLVGPTMIIEIANDKMLGYWGKDSSVIGLPHEEAIPELKGQPFSQLLMEVYTTGVTYEAKAALVKLNVNGAVTPFFFDFTYKPMHNAAGQVYAIMATAVDVTEQVQTRRAIEASEAKLKSVIASAPAAIGLFVGRDLLVEMPNQAFIDIVGKGPDIVGKPLREVMPELENQPFLQILDDVYTTGIMFQSFGTQVNIVQHGVMTNNFYNITYSPLFDADGNVYAILDIAIDVTERVLAHQLVEESREQLLASFTQSPVAIAVISATNLTFTMANPFYGQLVGRNPDDLINKPLLDALPELRGQGFDLLLTQVIQTATAYIANEVSADIVRNNQLETIYVDLHYQPQSEINPTTDQDEVTGVLVIATDVTQQVLERKKVEAEKQRFHTLLEVIPTMTWTSTPAGSMDFFNRRWFDYTGLDLEQSRGTGWQTVIHDNDLARTLTTYQHALDTGDSFVVENRYRRADGSYRWHLNRSLPIVDETGTVTMWVGTATDIHAQKELEAELEQQVQKRTEDLAKSIHDLKRSNQNLQQFAYIASHDLQEPLRKVQQFGDLLHTQYASELGDGADYLTRMQLAASRMSTLIRDLLTYSRISVQQESTTIVPLDIVLQRVLTDLELTIDETAAIVEVGPMPRVFGDDSQLGQLFQNLLANSLKFRRPMEAPIVTVKAQLLSASNLPKTAKPTRLASQYHQISVSDNGIGFDQKYGEQIFQVFQRLHGKNEFAGTGIGLAICEKVVANHGGAIIARSQPGNGATFDVYLPA